MCSGGKPHHAIDSHNAKSRVQETAIANNLIMDDPDGNSSFAIDLPNGAIGLIRRNLIQKSLRTESINLIFYGNEEFKYCDNRFEVVENILTDESGRSTARFLKVEGTEPIPEDDLRSGSH